MRRSLYRSYPQRNRASAGRDPTPVRGLRHKPQKPEGQHDPEAERLRNKDVGDQSPDLAMTNARRIEIEGGSEIGVEPHQRPHQRSEANHDSDQSGDGKETKAAFEFIQPAHCWRKLTQQSL